MSKSIILVTASLDDVVISQGQLLTLNENRKKGFQEQFYK